MELDIDIVMEKLEVIINQVKDEAYGRSTITRKKKRKIDDEMIWKNRMRMIEKHARLSDRVYQTKKIVERDERFIELEAMQDPKTGEILQTRDQIFKYVLDYNIDVLSKNEAPGNAVYTERYKSEAMEQLMEVEDMESLEPIKIEEFIEVLEQLTKVKKKVYNDLLLAGPKFKVAVYMLMQQIYLTEQIPRSFKKTVLMPLYKGKGSRRDLANHCFLHLKNWGGKVFEKLIMKKVNARVRCATPPLPQGGQPDGSTIDHLVETMTIIKSRMKRRKACVLTLMDVKKCFDKCKLNDILYEFGQAGVNGKQLQMIKNFNDGTRISIQGDCDKERGSEIFNSVGQGTNCVVDGAALMMGRVIEEKFCKDEASLMMGDVRVDPTGFIDDVAVLRGGAREAREAGQTHRGC